MKVVFRPNFLRQYKKLHPALQKEAKEKIALLRESPNSSTLECHKLIGKMKGSLSFSINYRYRIIYEYENPHRVALLAVGDHDVYS